MTYEAFIAPFEKQTKTRVGVLVKCPAHNDGTASLQVCRAGDGKIMLHCFAGCKTESVVAALGLTMKDLFPDTEAKEFKVPASNGHSTAPTEKPIIEKVYSYQNQTGQEVYQVVRLKPKSFRQRHMVDGKWVWSMEGVTRFLYHTPEVLKAKEVWLVEGEKDADNLTALGFVATCNVGGAGKWLDAYTETLAGRDVTICGDNDAPGQEHVEKVFESICGAAKTVRIVNLPKTVKDISDFIATFPNPQSAKAALEELREAAHPFIQGVKLPIYTMSELEPGYKRMVNSLAENSFDLGKWLPTLGQHVRPVICGELAFIIGDTGAGKTGVLSEIARAALPLPTLFFELELPPELLFERTVSAQINITCREVEAAYRSGDSFGLGLDVKFKNLFLCTQSKITLADLENYIVKSELKIGERPKLVLIDYVQLISAQGVNRREKVSDIAEGLKVLAKTTRTIIVCASQVHRPDGDEEIHLHSAKESGSIENSCGLLLGAWRDENDKTLMYVKVLKSTKGGNGTLVECNFDGARMRITERSKISAEDVPKPYTDQ
jgi:replicative DNA helicase